MKWMYEDVLHHQEGPESTCGCGHKTISFFQHQWRRVDWSGRAKVTVETHIRCDIQKPFCFPPVSSGRSCSKWTHFRSVSMLCCSNKLQSSLVSPWWSEDVTGTSRGLWFIPFHTASTTTDLSRWHLTALVRPSVCLSVCVRVGMCRAAECLCVLHKFNILCKWSSELDQHQSRALCLCVS